MIYPIQLILSMILALMLFYHTWKTSKVADNVIVLHNAIKEGDNSKEMYMIFDDECRNLLRGIGFLVAGFIAVNLGILL